MGTVRDAPEAQVVHYMPTETDKVYIKEVRMGKGDLMSLHEHTYTHKSYLAQGRIRLVMPGSRRTQILTAPCCIVVPRGIQHEVQALQPSVWLCVHSTDEDNIELVDSSITNEVVTK